MLFAFLLNFVHLFFLRLRICFPVGVFTFRFFATVFFNFYYLIHYTQKFMSVILSDLVYDHLRAVECFGFQAFNSLFPFFGDFNGNLPSVRSV